MLFLAGAVMTSPGVSGQARLVEKVVRKGHEAVIPYERYVLPNGLTLLIHEDHSDPIVHVDVTYHVGSAREEIGKSGFAHFFEHMMFQGSDHVGDEQHFRIITEAGGTLNGTTNRDRTNYFETVPANQLEKVLWLEADRMGFLLDAVTQKKFEVQRATVKNERGQNYDNRPYGLLGEVTSRNLYPYGHPYSWLTIGYVEDLNRVNVDDLKNFFLRWYGPNNAVITIGGDVKVRQAVGWVEKYFGSIRRGPEVKPASFPLPILEKDRYVSYVDQYAKIPVLRMVFPTSASFSADEPALDLLAEIIGQGNNSLLYKNLVKTGKALSASAYNGTSELAGEFALNITPYPGQKLSDIEEMVRQTLAEFGTRGVTEEDLVKFRSKAEASIIYDLESVAGKVSRLASFYTLTGDANYLPKNLEANTSVRREDVMRVYAQYLKGKHAVIVSVLTKDGGVQPAAEDNHEVSAEGYKAPDYGYSGLRYIKPADTFDRSRQPSPGEPVVNKAPGIWKDSLGPWKVIGTQTDELPVVNIMLRFRGGRFLDTPGKEGLSGLFAVLMREDTKNYTSEAFNLALGQLGSSIGVYSGDDQVSVQVRCLKKNLAPTLDLLRERLLYPAFRADDFDRNKKQLTESLRNSLNQPSYVAGTVHQRLLYGSDSPLGRTATAETVQNIGLEDVRNYYRDNFSGRDGEIVVVGEVTREEILAGLSFLDALPKGKVELPVFSPGEKKRRQAVYFVDIPNSAQTEFRIGSVTGLKYDALGEFYKAGMANFSLGGSFNSRLNLHLREEKGWTYGARSQFAGDKYTGSFVFSAGIKAQATDSALVDVLDTIRKYRESGISEEELAFTKSSVTLSEARKYETGFQKAGFLNMILTYELPEDYTSRQNKLLKSLTKEEVSRFASAYIPDDDHLVVLLVGDKARVLEKIKQRGFDVIELDREGRPL